MATGGEPTTSQSYGVGTYVWISAPPASPNTAVVGTPIANPVTNADIGTLNGTISGSSINQTITQELTTMANAVPHEDFTNTMTEPQASVSTGPQEQQSTTAIDPVVLEATVIEVSEVGPSGTKFYDGEVEIDIKRNEKKEKVSSVGDKAQRRRLSPAHREMIIDLVFNEKKTSREVARYMGLPQSTVMSVVQVFKKEHRIHKKTATGRKRRLTTAQEFHLFEMSQERENVTVDEIRTRFLQQYPNAGHISKTTIYRTLERGKKGLIGMDPPEKFISGGRPEGLLYNPKKKFKPSNKNGVIPALAAQQVVLEPAINILEEAAAVETPIDKDSVRQRRSLSIAEREMIISLFFNENRTIREVADFMHLAKSTVSSVVQVFKKEHRIQRKASTGRKKKLSDEHEQMIMDILHEKEDITIEETRSRFLNSNPEVPNISKSTIYRIMENCQSKMARSDMEVFVGTFVHSTDEKSMMIMTDCVMGVLNSTIEFMESVEELDHLKAEYGFTDTNIHNMTPNQFLMPGLIDTHIHASQFPNNGLSMGLPLLEWLQSFTFPTEASYHDTLFARDIYTKVVDRLLRNGTTTAAYYGTIHVEGTKILADVVSDKGQRAIIGKVNQVRNCPDYYKEASVGESVSDTEEFIKYIKSLENNLILPVVTPRFAPTCCEDQMLALGQLAQKYNCHIQSHLCETQPEINWVKELFPWSKSYTHVFDSMTLLTEKTIMAHCVWMSDEELFTLRERGTGVSHCPISNVSLKSGICDVKRLLSHGLKVGLGTDCSGGYSSSMLSVMRMAVQSSHFLSMDRDAEFQTLTIEEAFQLATLGGAKVMNMEHKIGNFDIDKEFDALLIDVAPSGGSPLDIFQRDTIENKVKKFLFNGDDRNISRVYVSGKRLLDSQNKLV